MGQGTKGAGALQVMMKTTNNSYKMHDLELAESHPSVLRDDRILVCIRGGGVISKFEGVVLHMPEIHDHDPPKTA
jgi:hypothetical protein